MRVRVRVRVRVRARVRARVRETPVTHEGRPMRPCETCPLADSLLTSVRTYLCLEMGATYLTDLPAD